MRIRPLIVVLAAAACGGGKTSEPTTPAPSSEPAPAASTVDPAVLRDIASGLVEVLATMATITESAPDCPGMAVELTRLFDTSAELFELARAQGADPEAGPLLTAEVDRQAAAVQPLVERISRGLERCKLDPDVAAAMERMPTF